MNKATVSKISTTGLWKPPGSVGFLWGFAEGTLFFIIPDVLLGWASLAGVRCGMKNLGTILAGAIIAGILMYSWASERPEQSRIAVASVPFVKERMFGKVQQDYKDHGLSGMLYGPSSGIPYKVYAVLAPSQREPLVFVLMSIPARLERFALSWAVFAAIGWVFQLWIRAHARLTTALYLVFWGVTYALFWSRL